MWSCLGTEIDEWYANLPVKFWDVLRDGIWSVVLLVLAEDWFKSGKDANTTPMAVRCISTLME